MRICPGCESAITAQRAQSKAEVLSDRGNPQRATTFAAIFLDLAEASEFKAGSPHRFLLREAGSHVFLYLVLKMKSQLLVKFVLNRGATEKRTNAEK